MAVWSRRLVVVGTLTALIAASAYVAVLAWRAHKSASLLRRYTYYDRGITRIEIVSQETPEVSYADNAQMRTVYRWRLDGNTYQFRSQLAYERNWKTLPLSAIESRVRQVVLDAKRARGYVLVVDRPFQTKGEQRGSLLIFRGKGREFGALLLLHPQIKGVVFLSYHIPESPVHANEYRAKVLEVWEKVDLLAVADMDSKIQELIPASRHLED
ncbi:MAG: hypothetical protein RMK45_10910 [Armatimonadota bacterium]|nr:hypothetical protein [Armatimonadota bacterium]